MIKKSQQRPQQHSILTKSRPQVRLVETKTIDELSVFGEEELQSRSQQLHDELYSRHVPPFSREAAPWEVELAYVQREQDIRRGRKARHREYNEQLRKEEVDESRLPMYEGNPPPIWN